MIQQIGLDSSKEQFSYDNEKHINIGLDSNQGLLPVDGASSILNEYEKITGSSHWLRLDIRYASGFHLCSGACRADSRL